jgi:ABC-2 type transport system ATP-binding protein
MTPVISVRGLSRVYKSKKSGDIMALKDVNFDVFPKEVFGLLGPNGAGKTTLIKILATLLSPSSGNANIFGYPCFGGESHIRPNINFLFGGERSLYWRLSAVDNLKYFADLYLIPRKEQKTLLRQTLQLVNLEQDANRKVETFSKGMKQRLQIARSILNKPKVLLLDEPTIGLDPHGARDLRKLILDISAAGTTVILTTHYMPEAEELCDRIAILNHGTIVAIDDIAGLRQRNTYHGKLRLQRNEWNLESIRDFIADTPNIRVSDIPSREYVDIFSSSPEVLFQELLLQYENKILRGIQILDITLEDIYIDLVEG